MHYLLILFYLKKIEKQPLSIYSDPANTDLAQIDRYMDLLEKFITYFKQKAQPLMLTADLKTNRIILPELAHLSNKVTKNQDHQLKNLNRCLTEQIQKNHHFVKKYNLTPRELECFKLLLQGYSAKASGQKLNISPRTIECHIKNIKEKLSCHRKIDLIRLGQIFDYPSE